MPNWCENILTGPKEILETFISEYEGGEKYFDFNKILPMPTHQPDLSKPNPFFAVGGLGSEEEKKFSKNNWYAWSVENWGTKWNACHSQVESIVDGMIYFDTAWSPPKKIFAVLIEKYPEYDWSLDYDESGMCFAGRLEYKKDDPDTVTEIDMGWIYNNTPEKCPSCKAEYMYTGQHDDTHVIKRCDECGYEVALDSDGNIVAQGEEDTVWVTLQTSKETSNSIEKQT